MEGPELTWLDLRALAHEYCHAHQDWVVDPDGYSYLGRWPDTPEGEAYVAAEAADETAGYEPFGRRGPVEDAAEFCAHYYYEVVIPGLVRDRARLQRHWPHRYEWAATWLSRR